MDAVLSKVNAKLEALFDILNDAYFEGQLPRPVITIQSRPATYGSCSNNKCWKAKDLGWYEINIGAENLNRPSKDTAATMLHEMVHLYCRVNEFEETCQKGRYHNKLFKLEAEKRDLKIGYNSTIGYSITEPTDTLIKTLTEAGFSMKVAFTRETPEKVKVRQARTPSNKYTCPSCGQTVSSIKTLHISCSLCEVKMECEVQSET
jgi:hypothetical protein